MQLATDEKHKLIVASEVVNDGNDSGPIICDGPLRPKQLSAGYQAYLAFRASSKAWPTSRERRRDCGLRDRGSGTAQGARSELTTRTALAPLTSIILSGGRFLRSL